MIGRPSQPDLGNTSVGKPDNSGPCEDSAVTPSLGKAAFLLPAVSFQALTTKDVFLAERLLTNYERISL